MNRVHDETSEALLAAAHRLLAGEGPDALTVRRIATEAGMSTMNVYSRFGGKDGVIDELYVYGYNKLFDAIEQVEETDDALDDLRRVAIAYRTFATEHPMYYEIMFRGANPSTQSVDRALAGLGNFVARLERAAERGAVRFPADLDSTAATAWLWGTCHGLVSLELDGIADEVVDWAKIYASATEVAITGLRPAAFHDSSN
ncbi:MAG: TetR/AcrR family transcriptional regulator [Ilumatobacter fluminis]|uniref:TetR/AcrR family transcriptional regulator n=1 Tax=Ilumatobacter fluminis TaxID=467091 RepID=UPI0032EF4B2E